MLDTVTHLERQPFTAGVVYGDGSCTQQAGPLLLSKGRLQGPTGRILCPSLTRQLLRDLKAELEVCGRDLWFHCVLLSASPSGSAIGRAHTTTEGVGDAVQPDAGVLDV